MNTQGLTRSSHFWGSISASLFRIQKSSRAPPTPPTIASKALITLIIHLLLSAAHGPRGPGVRTPRVRTPLHQHLSLAISWVVWSGYLDTSKPLCGDM